MRTSLWAAGRRALGPCSRCPVLTQRTERRLQGAVRRHLRGGARGACGGHRRPRPVPVLQLCCWPCVWCGDEGRRLGVQMCVSELRDERYPPPPGYEGLRDRVTRSVPQVITSHARGCHVSEPARYRAADGVSRL
eukprot:3211130-Rhodomonas_salina.2